MPSLITCYLHTRPWSLATLTTLCYNDLLCACPFHQMAKLSEQGLASISSFSRQHLVKTWLNQTFKLLTNKWINCSRPCWWAPRIPSVLVILTVKINKQKSHLNWSREARRENSRVCHSIDTSDPNRNRSILHLGQEEVLLHYLIRRKERFLFTQ